MKYLIKVDGKIAGYDRLDVLEHDLIINKPSAFKLFVKVPHGLSEVYEELTHDEIIDTLPIFYKESEINL